MANQVPSKNPADEGTLTGAFRQAFRKLMQNTDGMLPAQVIAVSADRQFVTCRPNIMVLGTDGSLTARAQIAKVPVLSMGAGNFALSFPIAPDDLGWILASDRDISLYLQSGAQAGPNTQRLHSFEDGVFIPDKARKYTLAGEDADNAVWQSLDGSVRIALGDAYVKVTAPEFIVNAPVATFTGNITAAGTITGTTDVVAGTILVKTHKHGGVTVGAGNTGVPHN